MINFFKRWFSKNADKQPVTEEDNLSPIHSESPIPRGFLERYLAYLKGDHAYLKFRGLSHGHIPTIALNSVYIALKAVAGEGYAEERQLDLDKVDKETDKIQRTRESVSTQFLETNFYQAEEQIQHKFSLESLLTDHPRLVIVGEPGSGKTTLLEYIILELIETPELFGSGERPIPLFFPVRSLKPCTLPSPNDFPEICVPDVLRSDCPADFFRQYIKAGNCVFLFDGLDEVTLPEERRKVSKWIDELCAAFPDNRYIVTSRIIGYREAPLHNGFYKSRLCDFDREDIKQFVFNWQMAITEDRSQESESNRKLRIKIEVDRILEVMKEKPGIRQLASNPLLLTIVLLVYNNRTRLPEERGRLYDECINVLLEHLQKARLEESKYGAFKPAQSLKLDQQRDLLKSMAYWLHERGLREEEEKGICNEILANQLPTVGLDPSYAEQFIKEIEERSGLIIHRGSGVGFSHLTFQEYLTALALADNEDREYTINFLLNKKLSSWWHEVIQLYASIIADASFLIRQLLKEDDTELHHVLLLAGQCLADARKVSDIDLRKQIINKLADLYLKTPFNYICFLARQVLVRIGTPEVASVFINILETEQKDILRVRDAVEVLSRLHTGTDVKAPLIRLLAREKLPEEIKQIALRGLQNVGLFDENLKNLLFSFMIEKQIIRTRQEVVTTLSILTSEPTVVQRIRTDILENEKYTTLLDEVYVAAVKGFIKHLPGEEAIHLLTSKMYIPEMAEYKVELCRAMTTIKISQETLSEHLLNLLKNGIDWGAKGGAALAMGLLNYDREQIAHQLADCLTKETDIGVRLRLADALGHLGWHDMKIANILRQCLADEHHFHTRWKLVEACALLARQDDFIEKRIVASVFADSEQDPEDKDRLEAITILCKLEYYTDDLVQKIIQRLYDFSSPIRKKALLYLSTAPSIPETFRSELHDYLNDMINNESMDGILRNRAFETLYNFYDILVEPLDD